MAVLLTILALGAIALAIARPARFAGVDNKQISSSIADELPRDEDVDCREDASGRHDGTAWSCQVATTDSGGSGLKDERTYLAEADEWGCWDAEWAGGAPVKDDEQAIDGCIGILNYVFD